MLEINNVNYSYKSLRALKDINLSFLKAGLIGLLGHNGCGKSTLLKILGASFSCKQGSIRIDGDNALDSYGFIKSHLRSRLGVLFQGSSSDNSLCVRDNLLYFAKLMGLPRQSHAQLGADFLKHSQLNDRADEPVKKLSEGMRRRLELYRTFMHKPSILLLDEPTEGLDFLETARFLEFLSKYIKEERALVIMATHRAVELEHCDQIVMMHEGSIIAEQSPHSLLKALDYTHVEVTLKNKASHICYDSGLFMMDPANPNIWRAQVVNNNLASFLKNNIFLSEDIQSVQWFKPALHDVYNLYKNKRESCVN
jgi:ABC-2 type transport system ATP-binding protein